MDGIRNIEYNKHVYVYASFTTSFGAQRPSSGRCNKNLQNEVKIQCNNASCFVCLPYFESFCNIGLMVVGVDRNM